MTIYSLYIYDRYVRSPGLCTPCPLILHANTARHCECVYYQDWYRTRTPRPPANGNYRPGVARYAAPPGAGTAAGTVAPPSERMSGAGWTPRQDDTAKRSSALSGGGGGGGDKGLPFDEEAKLVYGVVLSLRNMVKKLSGR